jgi:ribosome-binding protein aMBF1 (putative translation factor)
MTDRAEVAKILANVPGAKCSHCNGTGKVPALPLTVGAVMREMRIARGRTIRSMAKKLEITSVHLSDLEHGRKEWTEELLRAFAKEMRK